MAISKAAKHAAQTQARERLLEIVAPGATVYTIITHRSASGMSRRVKALAVEKGEISDISWLIHLGLGYRWNDEGSVVVNGCGFDAAYDVVHSLGATLWPNGTPDPHGTRNGRPDTAGGYALKHRAL